MPGLSDTLESALLNWLFKSTAFGSVPTDLYISLHSADPSDTGASELSGNGYARVLNDVDSGSDTNWNAIAVSGTTKVITNKTDITFPTASGDWNSGSAIKWFGIWSASTSGTFYVGGTINGSTGVVVLSGNTLKFLGGTPGSLSVSVD